MQINRQPNPAMPLQADSAGRVIVIGGSMAGLCAARVLADHFDRVMVVERDHFPSEPGERKGVPQARHVHVLLAQGQRALEQLFPGLASELAGRGALIMDWTAECMTRFASGWGRRMPSNLLTLGCSRDLLEWTVRERVRALPNVTFCAGMEVTGLLSDATNRTIQGVMARPRGEGEPGAPEAVAADLVVDASGRGSHSPDWLEGLGYGRPRESIVNAFLGYASRWYRKPANFTADWKALLITGYPPDMPYGGVLLPVEGDRWLVTLGGRNRQYPPTDEAGFLEFARKLPDPLLYESIRQAEPLTPIYGYRRTENRRVHYEEMSRWPARLLIVGDAACAFNPIYGQGMTAAAMGARALDEHLRGRQDRQEAQAWTGEWGLRFQQALAKVNDTTWLLATGEDFRWPETEGVRPARNDRLVQRYVEQVTRVAANDALVNQAFAEVLHLVKPPAYLFHPRIAWRVLCGLFSLRLISP